MNANGIKRSLHAEEENILQNRYRKKRQEIIRAKKIREKGKAVVHECRNKEKKRKRNQNNIREEERASFPPHYKKGGEGKPLLDFY